LDLCQGLGVDFLRQRARPFRNIRSVMHVVVYLMADRSHVVSRNGDELRAKITHGMSLLGVLTSWPLAVKVKSTAMASSSLSEAMHQSDGLAAYKESLQ
jgi:hypothetical protein